MRSSDVFPGSWRYELNGLLVQLDVQREAVRVTFEGRDGTRWAPVWIRLFPGSVPVEVDLSESIVDEPF